MGCLGGKKRINDVENLCTFPGHRGINTASDIQQVIIRTYSIPLGGYYYI